MKNFHELSYTFHVKMFTENDDENKKIRMSWFREDTVDYWRHFRMIEPLTGLLKQYKNSDCVTIGDGRFGLDSVKLKKIEPSLCILPTDIVPHLLQEAKKLKIIPDFRVENAEHLSFANEQFDFTFCIESYHHFVRPYIALYEMIRISRKGIILIEPNDAFSKQIPRQFIESCKSTLHKFTSQKKMHPDQQHFEESGNYVFTVSKREVEKIAISLQLPAVAFYYFNDYYEKGVEFEKQSSRSRLFRKVRRKINWSNLKCRIGLSCYSGIIAVIFKEKPTEEVINDLQNTGFDVVQLPANPYLPMQ
jgi:ubiquinone/menaquinone biosynthesis C-methylase UbiE